MMASSELRWGIIGLGRFGRIHARVIESLPGNQLVAICNRNSDRLQSAQEELGVELCYDDHQQMLQEAELDVVSITTHWRDHFVSARDALQSGRHVFLEKPMAASLLECQELLAVAASAPGQFMVGHICRFDPRVSQAKRAVEAGRIGRIVSMHAKRNLPQAPGHLRLDKISPLIGDGVHDADLMLWFMGRKPNRVFGRNVQFLKHQYPDVGWALLEFGDDAIGVVETNWGLPPNVATTIDAVMQIVGTDGMLTIDCAQTGLEILDGHGSKRVDTVYWPESHGQPVGVLRDELAYFADCVRRNQPPSVVTPREAFDALAVMLAAEESAQLGRPVEIQSA